LASRILRNDRVDKTASHFIDEEPEERLLEMAAMGAVGNFHS